jgi:DNA-binding HxlR family transcriptional regulator
MPDGSEQERWAHKMCDALRSLRGRWKLLILAHLRGRSPLRLSELERLIPEASQKVLIDQLRALERDGLVDRTVFPEVPPRVEYSLTSFGEQLGPSLDAVESWADARAEHHAPEQAPPPDRAPWQKSREPRALDAAQPVHPKR